MWSTASGPFTPGAAAFLTRIRQPWHELARVGWIRVAHAADVTDAAQPELDLYAPDLPLSRIVKADDASRSLRIQTGTVSAMAYPSSTDPVTLAICSE